MNTTNNDNTKTAYPDKFLRSFLELLLLGISLQVSDRLLKAYLIEPDAVKEDLNPYFLPGATFLLMDFPYNYKRNVTIILSTLANR